MTNTIFITGASSGIGQATVIYFHQKGWNVIASMRDVEKKTEFSESKNLIKVAVDVTKPETMQHGIQIGLDTFGSIDVFVNNAGFSVVGPFESTDQKDIEKEISTNILGVMYGTKAILPHFREKRGGVIINIASMGGKFTFPLYSIYHASKWAVEGFSESIQFELAQFGIKIKIIEPGTVKTNFYTSSVVQAPALPPYTAYVDRVLPFLQQSGMQGSNPEVIAKLIFSAATDSSSKLRYAGGKNAKFGLFFRKLLPEEFFIKCMRFLITHRISI